MNYHIARDGQQIGVFPEEEVRLKFTAGEFRGSDLCWTEGMTDWQPLDTVIETTAPSTAINPYAPPAVDVSSAARRSSSAVLATLGQRLGASLLDALTALGCMIPLMVGFGAIESSTNEWKGAGGLFVALGGLALLGLIVYNVVLLTQRGQTLGKKWLDIRIVTVDDQSNPGFVKAVLLRSFVNAIIANVVPFYGLVDICFIFREDRRCIHDLIAGTQVVQGNP